MNDVDWVFFIVGIFVIQISARTLKLFIKQKRPWPVGEYSKTYGMPSGRASVMFYIITYIILSLQNKTFIHIIIILLVGFGSLAMKYISKEHNVQQLFAGMVLGSTVGFIWKYISSKCV